MYWHTSSGHFRRAIGLRRWRRSHLLREGQAAEAVCARPELLAEDHLGPTLRRHNRLAPTGTIQQRQGRGKRPMCELSAMCTRLREACRCLCRSRLSSMWMAAHISWTTGIRTLRGDELEHRRTMGLPAFKASPRALFLSSVHSRSSATQGLSTRPRPLSVCGDARKLCDRHHLGALSCERSVFLNAPPNNKFDEAWCSAWAT